MADVAARSRKIELTIQAIDRQQPTEGGDFLMWDTEVPGFGLRVKPTGTKSFVLTYRNRHGRSRWITIARFGVMTPTQARKMARAMLARVAEGHDPAERRTEDRAAPTVKQLCEDYLDKAEAGLILTKRGASKKASTMYVDRGRVLRHIVPLLGPRPARDVTPADIRRFVRDVASGKTATDIKTAKKRGRSIVSGGPGAAARTVGLLGAIFSYALAEGIVTANPVAGVVKPRDQRKQVRLDRDGYRALGLAISNAEARGENPNAVAAAKLLALTGARRSEILQLRWREVDLAGRCLRLEDSKTGASFRPLGRPAVDLLVSLREQPDADFVFPGRLAKAESGKPATAAPLPFGGFPKAWLRMVGGTPVAGVSPHGLRHAFAAVSDDLDFSIVTTAALLGHSSSAGGITGRYITKADATLLEAADRVATWIDSAMRGRSAEIVAHPAVRR